VLENILGDDEIKALVGEGLALQVLAAQSVFGMNRPKGNRGFVVRGDIARASLAQFQAGAAGGGRAFMDPQIAPVGIVARDGGHQRALTWNRATLNAQQVIAEP
jgi:hypothetical protein